MDGTAASAVGRLEAGEGGASVPYSVAPSFDYVPSLDGLRAVSIALVIIGHFGLRHVLPGAFGVTVFFFVSGFLITRQVLAEQALHGQLSLGAFYMRRLLRLYPALLVTLAVGGSVFVALGGRFPWGQVAAGVFYFTNYFSLFSDYLGVPDGMYNPFSILWSLAVEEHYYLVYPALVVLLGRQRLRFAAVLCMLIAAVTLWRLHVVTACSAALPTCSGDGFDNRIMEATDTRVDSILYGAVLATLLGTRYAAGLLSFLQHRAVIAAGLALLAVSFVVRDTWFREALRFSVQGVGLFLTVGAVLFSRDLGWLRAILSCRISVLVGRWSYSLYLWHSIVLTCVAAALPAWMWRPAVEDGRLVWAWDLVGIPVVFALSLAVAALSYRFVETPMVALRRRFGSHALRDGTPIAPGQILLSSNPATAAAPAANTNGAPANLTGKAFWVKA